jgi:hypothetical protein
MVRKEMTEFPITSGNKNLLIDDCLPDVAPENYLKLL